MRLKEKKYFKKLPPPLKKFSAQGAKKVDYGKFFPIRVNHIEKGVKIEHGRVASPWKCTHLP